MSLSIQSFLNRRRAFFRRVWDLVARNPEALRHAVRGSQPGQIILCLALGLVVGLVTMLLHEVVLSGHRFAYDLGPAERLSDAGHIEPVRIVAVPMLGGLLAGLAALVMKRFRKGEIVDPIEANATMGGRMSIIDSARLLLQALISNAAGASVGMEAAYTQVGSSLCSWTGHHLQLRRDDMRIFVAAGAAAAISAAFNAPLAGAFYGFELVLGTYTIAALPQIAICALSSALLLRTVSAGDPIFTLPLNIVSIPPWDFPLFAAVGILSAQIGIATMKAVARCEQLSGHLPVWVRPALGGFMVSLIALFLPQVLGSGQGAITEHLMHQGPMLMLALLVLGKMAASAISIGFGFRGGLFSSSLLMGCLFGQLAGVIASAFLPPHEGQLETFMLVGMGAVGTSIVGAPVTMVLLVLEMTGNYPATIAVMVGVLVSSIVTRFSFGYSFSTWRFHLRGLRIASAHDIGWIGELTVASLMQQSPIAIRADMTVAALRAAMPPGSAKRLYVVDAQDRYVGTVELAALYDHDLDAAAGTMLVGDQALGREFTLLPWQNIRDALDLFARSELEALPVLYSRDDCRIAGAVSEPYILKRYAHELEARNLAQSGAGSPLMRD